MVETILSFRSLRLSNTRPVWVLGPEAPGPDAALVVFLDGELYRDRVGAVPLIRGLAAGAEVPEAIYAFVSMAGAEERWRECPCHPPFAEAVSEELLPWIEAVVPGARQARRRVLAGLSYTGLAAAYVNLRNPGLFGRVICQSGSFWWNDCWVVDRYREAQGPVGAEFYLDVGSRETQAGVLHREGVFQGVSQREGVRRFRDAVAQRGGSARYAEFDGAHDFAGWRATLPGALRWSLGP
jgi:enterochelin esterase family protein